MLKCQLSKKAVTIKRIQATVILSVLFFIYGAIAVFSVITSLALSFFTIIIYIIMIFPFLNAWYNSYSYSVTPDCIKIKKGVLVSKQICIFKNKVQYAALIQTPLQRFFRTCTVIYHTAGAVVYLSEIDEENSYGAVFNEKLQT